VNAPLLLQIAGFSPIAARRWNSSKPPITEINPPLTAMGIPARGAHFVNTSATLVIVFSAIDVEMVETQAKPE
jgi:hypothetical protein